VEDYEMLSQLCDFGVHELIIDVGGGFGALLEPLHSAFPETRFVLFDRSKVIESANVSKKIGKIGGDFFCSIPIGADGLILARVIHDWPDDKASEILNNCYRALPAGGKIYLIENFIDYISDSGALLSLNMALVCKSNERTSHSYRALLISSGFTFITQIQVNRLQWMIVGTK
jgi:C-methyltransferase